MSYEVIDILHDKDLLRDVTKQAAQLHPENFQYFKNRIPGYTHFFIVKLDGELIAMSGIWRCDKWPENYYRVADRSFYFPLFRQKDISNPYTKPYKSTLSQVIIPAQTKIVLARGGFPFYSMNKHPNALKRSVKIHNEIAEHKYKVLDELYWTCPEQVDYNHKGCWQNIAVLEKYNECELPRYE